MTDELDNARELAPIVTTMVLEQATDPLPVEPKQRQREGDRRTRRATAATVRELKRRHAACQCDPAEALAFVERVASAVVVVYQALRKVGIIKADGTAPS
jgi:hypothetical protein